jgi:hypothetical protein
MIRSLSNLVFNGLINRARKDYNRRYFLINTTSDNGKEVSTGSADVAELTIITTPTTATGTPPLLTRNPNDFEVVSIFI